MRCPGKDASECPLRLCLQSSKVLWRQAVNCPLQGATPQSPEEPHLSPEGTAKDPPDGDPVEGILPCFE